MFVDGQLQFGRVIEHTVQGTPGAQASPARSGCASARNILFNGINWTVLDGYPVDDMANLEFSNQLSTSTQFTVQRDSSFNSGVTLSNWIFDTAPTSGGLYISATDLDGATSGVLTITMSNTSPSVNGGFVSTSGGAVINGWSAAAPDIWQGISGVWTNPANWSLGVPTSTSDVVINCDCSSPTTPGAIAIHNLTITNGNQLLLGGQLTVNGDLSVASGSDINVSSANLVLRGNVTMDPTASPGGVFCGSGTTGAMLTGTGTQNVYWQNSAALTVSSSDGRERAAKSTSRTRRTMAMPHSRFKPAAVLI